MAPGATLAAVAAVVCLPLGVTVKVAVLRLVATGVPVAAAAGVAVAALLAALAVMAARLFAFITEANNGSLCSYKRRYR